jgi:hypothetical protein
MTLGQWFNGKRPERDPEAISKGFGAKSPVSLPKWPTRSGATAGIETGSDSARGGGVGPRTLRGLSVRSRPQR